MRPAILKNFLLFSITVQVYDQKARGICWQFSKLSFYFRPAVGSGWTNLPCVLCRCLLMMSGLIKWWQKRTMAIISQLQTIQLCTLSLRPGRGAGGGGGVIIIEDVLILMWRAIDKDIWWELIIWNWWEYQRGISPHNPQVISLTWRRRWSRVNEDKYFVLSGLLRWIKIQIAQNMFLLRSTSKF